MWSDCLKDRGGKQPITKSKLLKLEEESKLFYEKAGSLGRKGRQYALRAGEKRRHPGFVGEEEFLSKRCPEEFVAIMAGSQ